MSLCDKELAATFAAIESNFRWRCRPLPDGQRIGVTTSRMLADSEPLTLQVALSEDVLTVSDGGETLNRLAGASFDVADPVLANVWKEALRTYRIHETDGRVFLQTRIDRAAHALNRFADALIALDGLRVLGIPPGHRTRTLADEVEHYLASIYEPHQVRHKPQIRLVDGIMITPALRVETPSRGGVIVQPGAATSTTQSYDHAYATMGLARRGGFLQQHCLVVLGGRVAAWNVNRLRALSDIAFVGFWEDREQVRRFLDGSTPDDALMVPAGFNVPLES